MNELKINKLMIILVIEDKLKKKKVNKEKIISIIEQLL